MSTVIDAHLHVWRLPRDPGQGAYRWLTPDLGVLHRDYPAGEAGAELAAAGVGAAVLVQADDTLADTEMMLDVCARHAWAVGVVGWVRLDTPGEAAEQLARWTPNRYFRGVRHLVHDDPRPDFLELAAVRRSLVLLVAADLPLDIPDAFPRHLQQVADLAAAVPDLTVVVDHLGKPPLGDGPGSSAFTAWSEQLRAVARRPRTVAKLSGLRIPGARYDVATLAPAIDVALEAFGADRLMYGGDWPMTVPGGGYGPTLEVLRDYVSRLSPGEQDAIWHGTARRVYAL